jgi:hypothetical protein
VYTFKSADDDAAELVEVGDGKDAKPKTASHAPTTAEMT